jgi:ribonuclease HI
MLDLSNRISDTLSMNEPCGNVFIYTDGACQSNPGPGGYGVVMISGGQRREFSGGFRNTTNNRMELFSVISALREVKQKDSRITIYSDAKYVVSMYNGGYARQWRQNGWTRNQGKDKAMNPDLWGMLLDLCSACNVEFVWVKGHSSNKENERCDELAVAARQVADLPADEYYEELTAAAALQPSQLMLFPE